MKTFKENIKKMNHLKKGKLTRIQTVRKAAAAAVIGSLALSGCGAGNANQASAINPGDYSAILPYESSNMRGKHVGLISDIDIRYQLENGLMNLAKQYFPTSDVAYKTHAFLDFDELDATDGSRGLLGTLRDDNPNGLNPGADEVFDTGNGQATGPLLLVDLYELDFYQNDSLRGIAIGLAVPDTVEIDGEDKEITQEAMESYLKVTANKIVQYLRQRFNEIGNNVPILVAAYQLNTDPISYDKGGYIYEAYFNGTNTTYTSLNEKYVLVPSTEFTEMDPEMASQFSQFKSDVSTVLADSTYTTGEARFEDGVCRELDLKIQTYGKTSGETLAVIQSVREKLSVFTSEDCAYRVQVYNNKDICALMYRPEGSGSVNVVSTY